MLVPDTPKKRASIVLRDLGAEAMLYDPEGDKVVRLNRTARRIWELCDGRCPLHAIAATLQTEFSIDPRVDIRGDVAEAVARFAAAGLLINSGG